MTEGEFEDDAAAESVRDVIVPKGQVPLFSSLWCEPKGQYWTDEYRGYRTAAQARRRVD